MGKSACASVWYFLKQPIVQAEMQGSPDTAAILEALQATKATAKERHAEMERKIRQVSICPHSLCVGEEYSSSLYVQSTTFLMKIFNIQVQIVQLMYTPSGPVLDSKKVQLQIDQ